MNIYYALSSSQIKCFFPLEIKLYIQSIKSNTPVWVTSVRVRIVGLVELGREINELVDRTVRTTTATKVVDPTGGSGQTGKYSQMRGFSV